MTSVTDLTGRVALITGAGRGIGRESALLLAAHGARVVVNDIDADAAQDTVTQIESGGGRAVCVIGSVTEPEFPQRFVTAAVEQFGGLDIIVNNAGYVWDGVIQKMTDEQWDAIHDVHVKAPFRILRAAQPIISARAKAEMARGEEIFRKVINVSSIAATNGNAGQANYSSAKAAILGLTRTLAKEWGRYKVNVNAIAFGLIATRGMVPAAAGSSAVTIGERKIQVGVNPDILSKANIPLGRLGTPAEAAGAVFLLCTQAANYITGQTIRCDGGLQI